MMLIKRKWWKGNVVRACVALYLAAIIAPLAYYGWTDDGIIIAALLAMIIPTVSFLSLALLSSIWWALSPVANQILDLGIAIFAAGRDFSRKK